MLLRGWAWFREDGAMIRRSLRWLGAPDVGFHAAGATSDALRAASQAELFVLLLPG